MNVLFFFCRYEQWTAPEYYKSANSNFISSEDKRNKTIALESRREKLKKLLDDEKEQYAKEIEGNFFFYKHANSKHECVNNVSKENRFYLS